MTLEDLRAKVRKWDLQNSGNPDYTAYYSAILDQLDYHAVKEWRVYLPAEHPDYHPSYMERLAAWIGNLTDESEQKLLLEYALYISFFSHDDFVALYRTALEREVTRWIATQISARLEGSSGSKWHELLYQEIHYHTWFCPITDSMDINEFYKVNHLKGKGIAHRPGFATLQMLAEELETPDPVLARNIISYMESSKLERIVILEDIVGSGSQCLKAVRWAVSSLRKPVLFIPLILCPNGVEALDILERSNAGLCVRPVIQLRRSDLLGPERDGHTGWPITERMEDLATRCAPFASADMDPFGYKNTGCSLATFSNTPDNTLPIVHNKPKAGGWKPLFPRVYRD